MQFWSFRQLEQHKYHNPAEKKQNPSQNAIENVMDLMFIMGIVLVLMEMVSTGYNGIMVSTGM